MNSELAREIEFSVNKEGSKLESTCHWLTDVYCLVIILKHCRFALETQIPNIIEYVISCSGNKIGFIPRYPKK